MYVWEERFHHTSLISSSSKELGDVANELDASRTVSNAREDVHTGVVGGGTAEEHEQGTPPRGVSQLSERIWQVQRGCCPG